MMKRFVLATAILTVAASDVRSNVVYDLAQDWSNSSNPNGVWTYEATPGTALTHFISHYDPKGQMFTSQQGAWAYNTLDLTQANTNEIPSFFKAVAAPVNPQDDLVTGHVYLHNNDPFNSPSSIGTDPTSIAWTAPSAGYVNLSGGLWEVSRWRGRSEDWSLTLNITTVLTGGTATPTNNSSSNPIPFSSGSGGASALSLAVAQGDVIRFQVTRHSGEPFGTFIGVDFAVAFSPTAVPEPSSIVMGFISVGLVGGTGVWNRRRRS